MDKFLKVSKIEEIKVDKRGAKYVWVYFRPVITLPNGTTVLSNQKAVGRKIDDSFIDNEGRKFNGDALFQSVDTKELIVGSLVGGEIKRRATTGYDIDGKQVHFYTGVVFSNEDEIRQFNSKLRSDKACCLDDDGNPTVDMDSFKEAVTA